MTEEEKQRIDEVTAILDGLDQPINKQWEKVCLNYKVEVESSTFNGTVVIAVPESVSEGRDEWLNEHRVNDKGQHMSGVDQDSDDFDENDFENFDDSYNEDDDPVDVFMTERLKEHYGPDAEVCGFCFLTETVNGMPL